MSPDLRPIGRGAAYSIGVPLHGLGIAAVAAQGILAFREAGLLSSVLAPGLTDPALTGVLCKPPFRPVGGRWLNHLRPEWLRVAAFDRLAARRLTARRLASSREEPPSLLYGWAQYSLAQARAARRQGIRVVLDRGSAEATVQEQILRQAYATAGLPYAGPGRHATARGEAETTLADLVAVPSRYVYDTYRRAGVPEDKLWVNPLGVDLERFRPAPHSPEGPFRLAFVGTVGVRKGIVDLLAAWQRSRPSNAELVLVGGVLPEVAGLVAGFDTGSGVRATGYTADPQPHYAKAHALVLPSLEDGFGLVVLEAMACGLPVIVSDRTGAAECVSEGVDGYVVRAGDVDALAERMARLAGDRTRAATMGRAARSKAEQYPWSAYRQRLVERLRPWCQLSAPHGGRA